MTQFSEDEIIGIFKKHNAYWVYSGNPSDPHAELTSGLCSNGYLNCSNILCYPEINEILADNLYSKLIEAGIEDNLPDYVIGSAYAAITISYEVAKKLGAKYVFAEKSCTNPGEFVFQRWTIPEGSVAIQIEELITSLQTVIAVRKAVESQNKFEVEFSPIVGTIVFRPPNLSLKCYIGNQEIEIVSLIAKEIWAVPQEQCELCRAGSIRYRPKHNWDKLIKRI